MVCELSIYGKGLILLEPKMMLTNSTTMIQTYPYSHQANNGAIPHQAQSTTCPHSYRKHVDESETLVADSYLLRYIISGKEVIRQGILKHTLTSGSFLLVNPGQNLNIRPIGQEGSESITFHLPIEAFDALPVLFDQVYEAAEYPMSTLLNRLIKMIQLGESHQISAWEEWTRELAQELIASQQEVYAQMERISSAKLSTRQELFRRLSKAKRYIHTQLDTTLDLDTLSQVACLSKFHFIRLFKEAFEMTPRQYLISRRLDTASRLLIESSKSFHDICQEVGLKDSSSFGRLFKRNFGMTPHLYRQQHGIG